MSIVGLGKVVNIGTVIEKNRRRSSPDMSERIMKKPTKCMCSWKPDW